MKPHYAFLCAECAQNYRIAYTLTEVKNEEAATSRVKCSGCPRVCWLSRYRIDTK